MADIKLAESDGQAGNEKNDILIDRGILSLTANNVEEVRQRLAIRLATFLGEWFADISVGLPFFQQMLIKGADKDIVDGIYRSKITETRGVIDLINFNSNLNPRTRLYTVNFTVSVRDNSGNLTTITI